MTYFIWYDLSEQENRRILMNLDGSFQLCYLLDIFLWVNGTKTF